MPQVGFTAPDGTFYRWTKRTPPTQADVDALIAHHAKKRAYGPPNPNVDPLGDPADDPRQARRARTVSAADAPGFLPSSDPSSPSILAPAGKRFVPVKGAKVRDVRRPPRRPEPYRFDLGTALREPSGKAVPSPGSSGGGTGGGGTGDPYERRSTGVAPTSPPKDPGLPDVLAPDHPAVLAERAKTLPLNLGEFVNGVRGKGRRFAVGTVFATPFDDGERAKITGEEAAWRIAFGLGLTQNESPRFDIRYGPPKSLERDKKVVANLLNRKSATFKKVAGLLKIGGGFGLDDDLYMQAREAGASPAAAAIVKNDPGIGKATTAGLVGRSVGAAMSPTKTVRTLLGDARRDDELGIEEGAAFGITDLMLFGGISGAGAKGAALIGRGAAGAARGAATRGVAERVARRQVEKALATELSKIATVSAAKTAAARVAGRAASAALENVVLQAAPVWGQAADMTAANGKPFVQNLSTVGQEGAAGFLRLLDPRTPFNEALTPYERSQSALMIGLFVLGAGRKGFEGFRKKAAHAGIPPEIIRQVIHAGEVEELARPEQAQGPKAVPAEPRPVAPFLTVNPGEAPIPNDLRRKPRLTAFDVADAERRAAGASRRAQEAGHPASLGGVGRERWIDDHAPRIMTEDRVATNEAAKGKKPTPGPKDARASVREARASGTAPPALREESGRTYDDLRGAGSAPVNAVPKPTPEASAPLQQANGPLIPEVWEGDATTVNSGAFHPDVSKNPIPAIRRLVRQALGNPSYTRGLVVDHVDKAWQDRVHADTGVRLENTDVVIEADSVRHGDKRHTNAKVEGSRGQVPLKPGQWVQVLRVIRNYDTAAPGDKPGVVVFSKTIGKERVVVVAEGGRAKNKLFIKTTYTKAYPKPEVPTAEAKAATSETPVGTKLKDTTAENGGETMPSSVPGNAKKGVAPNVPTATSNATTRRKAEDLDAEFEALGRDLLRASGQASSGISPEHAVLVGKMVANRVRRGAVSVAEAVDHVLGALESKVAGLTRKDVEDAFAAHARTTGGPQPRPSVEFAERARLKAERPGALVGLTGRDKAPLEVATLPDAQLAKLREKTVGKLESVGTEGDPRAVAQHGHNLEVLDAEVARRAEAPKEQGPPPLRPHGGFNRLGPEEQAAAAEAAKDPVRAELPPRSVDYKTLVDDAQIWFKERQADESGIHTPALGAEVQFSGAAVGKGFKGDGMAQAIVPHIPKLLAKARLVYHEAPKRGDGSHVSAARLVARLESNEGAHDVWIVVRKARDHYYYDHGWSQAVDGPAVANSEAPHGAGVVRKPQTQDHSTAPEGETSTGPKSGVSDKSPFEGGVMTAAQNSTTLRQNAEHGNAPVEHGPAKPPGRAGLGESLDPSDPEAAVQRARWLKGNGERAVDLDPAAEKRIRDLSAQLAAKEVELTKAKDRATKAEAPEVVEQEKKTQARQDRRETLKAEMEDLGKRLFKEIGGGANAGLPLTPESMRILRRMALNALEQGALTLERVVANVRAALPEAVRPHVSDRHVHEALGGRWHEAGQGPPTETTTRKADVTAQARVTPQIEDLSERPQTGGSHSPRKRPVRSKRVRRLTLERDRLLRSVQNSVEAQRPSLPPSVGGSIRAASDRMGATASKAPGPRRVPVAPPQRLEESPTFRRRSLPSPRPLPKYPNHAL